MSARVISILVVAASVLGLAFALVSTSDYAQHLDRQMHELHCSFVPGAPASGDGDAACKAALFSPYSALFRGTYWGGVPVSLFAVGAFGFFAAFGLYLLLGRAPRVAYVFLALAGLGPLAASITMFVISLTRLHTFCKTCIGIYAASILLAVGAVLAALEARRPPASARPKSVVDPLAPTVHGVTPAARARAARELA